MSLFDSSLTSQTSTHKMSNSLRILCVISVLPFGFIHEAVEEGPSTKPNVLFIIVDDLNGLVGVMAPEIGAKTPNIDRLASKSTLFTNAHCAAPVCNPSRTAMLTGLRPSSTGIYDNLQAPSPEGHPVFKAVVLPAHFKNSGYQVIGAGKVFGHSTGSYHWDESFIPKSKERDRGGNNHTWGITTHTKEELPDWQLSAWAADQLAKVREKPLFLAIGFAKPHLPWNVPKEYFERFPAGSVMPPPLNADDSEDLPAEARGEVSRAGKDLIQKREEAYTAYLSAMALADDCIGRVLDALDRGPNADNTIVVLCGDNGFQIGEKNCFGKGRLWEESTHVPLMIRRPGAFNAQRCKQAVSLLDVYPSLTALCGLPEIPTLEGKSLVPLLKNPSIEWPFAALSTTGIGNHSVRTERWRYIRYAHGGEELYDHEKDPREWTNLATTTGFESIKTELRGLLPTCDAPRNPPSVKGLTDE